MGKIKYALIISILFISCQSAEDQEYEQVMREVRQYNEKVTSDSLVRVRERKIKEAEIRTGIKREDVKDISFD